MLNNLVDPRVREDKPLLKLCKKINVQKELEKAHEALSFEEIRGHIHTDRYGVGWSHNTRWSQASPAVRSSFIVQEKRRELENERIIRAMQHAYQGNLEHLGRDSPANHRMERDLKHAPTLTILCDTMTNSLLWTTCSDRV